MKCDQSYNDLFVAKSCLSTTKCFDFTKTVPVHDAKISCVYKNIEVSCIIKLYMVTC